MVYGAAFVGDPNVFKREINLNGHAAAQGYSIDMQNTPFPASLFPAGYLRSRRFCPSPLKSRKSRATRAASRDI
jgi:hypothetical protein